MRIERPFTGSLAPCWSSTSLLSELSALARNAEAALSAERLALSMTSPDNEPQVIGFWADRSRPAVLPRLNTPKTLVYRGISSAGMTAECQTERGDEFPMHRETSRQRLELLTLTTRFKTGQLLIAWSKSNPLRVVVRCAG